MDNNKFIKEFILNELSTFEFKKQTKGFKYLCEAIFICIEDIDAIDNLTKNVFPKIALKYKENSYQNIKWCINQIINSMYNNTEIKIIRKYFNFDNDTKPSLKLIIYTIVCKYKNKFNIL